MKVFGISRKELKLDSLITEKLLFVHYLFEMDGPHFWWLQIRMYHKKYRRLTMNSTRESDFLICVDVMDFLLFQLNLTKFTDNGK